MTESGPTKISRFAMKAVTGEAIVIHGSGDQRMSLCYVEDVVDGLLRLMQRDGLHGPVNIGSPEECSVRSLAELVFELSGFTPNIEDRAAASPDWRPRPDVQLAFEQLGWLPTVGLREGVKATVDYFAFHVARGGNGDGDLTLPGSSPPDRSSPKIARGRGRLAAGMIYPNAERRRARPDVRHRPRRDDDRE